jgi:acetylornithine deacetylase/succinyl-diaminopimelate desuccinylase-like protein
MTQEEQLLKELMLIPSPSGEEGEIGGYLFDLLKKSGFETKKYPMGKDRFNLVATLGKPKVYLAAHMDTVSPMLEYKETETHILGRGSCDTKGSVACMITAGVSAKSQGLTDFGLIFTVGEETVLDGAREIVKSGPSIPFVVVGEPTSLEIVNGHFGILIAEVSVKGKAAHSSRPEQGINAIDVLLDLMIKVREIPLGKGTLMSLVKINGGIADNIIPEEAKAMLSYRISPEDSTDYVSKIKSISPKEAKVTLVQEVKPVYCNVPKELSFIKTVKTVKYMTELSFYKKGVVLGPGDIKYAHGFDENVPRKELSGAVKIYERIIKNFSG